MTLYKLPSTFVEVDRNRVPNPWPSVNQSGWSSAGGASVSQVPHSGLWGQPSWVLASFRCTWVSGDAWGLAMSVGNYVPVTAGDLYTASAYVRSIDATRVLMVQVLWYSWDGSSYQSVPGGIANTLEVQGATFRRLSVAGNAPVGATHARIIVRATQLGSSGAHFDATAIMFTAGSLVEYFDGAKPGDAGNDYWWASTPFGSESVHGIPNASSTLEPIMTLAPYTARREAGTIVHRLLEDSQARFTWRQPNLPVGVFEFLFDGHAAAYAALSKLSARTAWALVDDADDGPIERWFMIAGGDIEMEQSREVENAYVVRVPYVEVDSI